MSGRLPSSTQNVAFDVRVNSARTAGATFAAIGDLTGGSAWAPPAVRPDADTTMTTKPVTAPRRGHTLLAKTDPYRRSCEKGIERPDRRSSDFDGPGDMSAQTKYPKGTVT